MLNVKPSRVEIDMTEETPVGVRKRLKRSALSVSAARSSVTIRVASVLNAVGRDYRQGEERGDRGDGIEESEATFRKMVETEFGLVASESMHARIQISKLIDVWPRRAAQRRLAAHGKGRSLDHVKSEGVTSA